MKFVKVSEAIENNGIKVLIHGPSGSGKTYSISTLPDLDRTLVISAEAGLLCLKDIEKDGMKVSSMLDTVTIQDIDGLREVHQYLKTDDHFKNIVLDSLSEIGQKVLATEKARNKDGRAAYGEMADIMVKMAKGFRDLEGKNVIMICQQEKTQDADGRILYGPSMPGNKVGQALPYLFDLVGCMRVKKDEEGNVKHAIQFIDDELYCVKDRSGKLSSFEKPNWENIFKKCLD